MTLTQKIGAAMMIPGFALTLATLGKITYHGYSVVELSRNPTINAPQIQTLNEKMEKQVNLGLSGIALTTLGTYLYYRRRQS